MNDLSDFRKRMGAQGKVDLSGLDFDVLRRMTRWGLLALAIIVAWNVLGWSKTFYTDWLWFRELGYDSVLVKIVATRGVLFAVAVAVFLGLALPGLYVVGRSTARSPRPDAPLETFDYLLVHKFLVRVGAAVIVLAAIFLGIHAASEWETVLLALNAVPFGEADPIFGRDFSFYIFTLPAVQFIHGWLITAVLGLGVILATFHYMSSRLRGEPVQFVGEAARKWLISLAAVLFLLIAAGHWLGRYELLFSPTGTVFGVGYTDDHVNLPGRTILAVVALATAGFLFAAAVRFRGYRWIVWPVAGWLVLMFLVGSAAPALMQRLRVEPSELALERDYLATAIEFTRRAFGLEGLESRDHPARGEIDAEMVADNLGTLRNVRLWDEGPLLQSYNQIQFFRLYYDFMAVHTDRYTVDGELRQVMLASRELSANRLPAEAQRWVNRHLQFTHGYGVAMSPVTEVEAGGRPTFFIRDVPPVGRIPLERPEIYYGLRSLDFVIARSGMQEFNYPGPEGPEYTSYEGSGGVIMGSFFRRLLYAWEFGDLNILITGEVEPESRIQYRRTVSKRVGTIAPFLLRDQEAYAVVADGRVSWIQDAYTVTHRYPYATRWAGRFNYIRNSVKAVVDAYDGSVDFYVFEPDDPLIRTYAAIFPGLFKPREAMPEHLRAHVRVPLDLFTVQTQMLLQYHMRDPVVFYNKEDQWDVPVQTSFGRSQPLRPYYIVARLPGETEEEFLLIQPFTPDNRHNLVGWMAARNDGEHYGGRILFRFPTGRHVDGPNQIEARIDNDAVISEQFTLWGQVGSEVMRGILLVIPMGDAILYAEPVFLKPETLEFPELRRIILADVRQVTMHQTLEASVDALIGKRPAVAPVAEGVVPEALGAEAEEGAGTRPATGDGAEAAPALVDSIRQELRQTIERLGELLDRLGQGGR
ncbi:MAG: UPF0182 family protein [Gemmatimonadota bacterium]|nr:UPF0182 family protein [Gemmatimonadota bacterium]